MLRFSASRRSVQANTGVVPVHLEVGSHQDLAQRTVLRCRFKSLASVRARLDREWREPDSTVVCLTQ